MLHVFITSGSKLITCHKYTKLAIDGIILVVIYSASGGWRRLLLIVSALRKHKTSSEELIGQTGKGLKVQSSD